jgi:UDP-N-acetylglucosamine 1-carboxyvinyltransferase
MLLGPLLSRFGEVVISNPGGDRIGRRPVDLHVEAMRALGAEIDYRYGYYYAKAPGRLRGTEVRFPFVSVMGTENAMLAATLADGHTVIRPAAQEPEVDDLIRFLQKMGAEVERTYPDTIEIEGKRRLRGAEYSVMPDRIEAGTFAIAAGVTGGHVVLESADCDSMQALVEVLGKAGLAVSCSPGRMEIDARAAGPRGLTPVDISTGPYPELATDIQPPTTVMLTQAKGDSRVHETIFEDRLEWTGELARMGASIELKSNQRAIVHGPAKLHAADVEISDLRAGASLILAALAAEGTSSIGGAHHVRRGYENIERKFLDLGARIERVQEVELVSPA